MWKLATEADKPMKTQLVQHFSYYQFQIPTLTVNVADIEHFVEHSSIHSDDWLPHQKAATIDRSLEDFFMKLNRILEKFKHDFEETQKQIGESVGSFCTRYKEHGITGQSYYDDFGNSDFDIDIDCAERATRIRDSVKEFLKLQENVNGIGTYFESAIDIITMFEIDAHIINESIGYIVYELSTIQ